MYSHSTGNLVVGGAEIFVKNGGEIYFLTAGSNLRLSSVIKSEPLKYTCGGRSLIRRKGGEQERLKGRY